MKEVFKPNTEIFKWGPIPFRLFYADSFNIALLVDFSKLFPGHRWPKALQLFKEGRVIWMNDFSELRESGGKLFMQEMLPKDRREKSRKRWKQSREVLNKIESKVEKTDLKKLIDNEFMKLWHEFHEKLENFWAHSILPELSNYGSDTILERELRKYIKDESELKSAMEILTAPTEMSFFQEEEIDLEKTNDLDRHQRKYFWIKNSYAQVEVLDVKFFAERKKNLEKNIKDKTIEFLKDAANKKKELQNEYNLPKKIIDIADAIADAIVWQDTRKKDIWIGLHYKDILLNEFANRHGINKDLLFNFHYYELERFNNKRLAEEAKKREYAFGDIIYKRIEILDSKTTLELWDKYAEEKVSKDIKEFSGIIASKGEAPIVKGKVKIILDPYKTESFNKGDILITTMTSPEFIFVMKNSSAIITDTGGLTSHAAIVSRELRKLCIVGTKIATKALKDGDLIEVDANTGVIRRL